MAEEKSRGGFKEFSSIFIDTTPLSYGDVGRVLSGVLVAWMLMLGVVWVSDDVSDAYHDYVAQSCYEKIEEIEHDPEISPESKRKRARTLRGKAQWHEQRKTSHSLPKKIESKT